MSIGALPVTRSFGQTHVPSLATTVPRFRFNSDHQSEFGLRVRKRVQEYFEDTGQSCYANWEIAVKSLVFLVLALACYGLILSGWFGPWMLLLLACGYGFFSLILNINAAHDAAHDALTPNRTFNRFVQTFCFILLGADSYLWRQRHIKSHHTFTNVVGGDYDLESNLFLRLSPDQPRRPYHRYQHLYAPFLFVLADIGTVLFKDFHYLFMKRFGNWANICHPPSVYVGFILGKLCYFGIVIVTPILVLDIEWWQVIVGWLAMTFVSSAFFVYLLIGSHYAMETVFPQARSDGLIDHDQAVHAMVTSLDWSPYSRTANLLFGGLNCHAAHHLFPSVHHRHCIAITRIIERTARECGVPYNVTTLPRMVASHFRFLKTLALSELRSVVA